MEFKYLKTRKENQTLWIEINNPPVNFLTMDILEELFLLMKKSGKMIQSECWFSPEHGMMFI
jgi:hypothetical protein